DTNNGSVTVNSTGNLTVEGDNTEGIDATAIGGPVVVTHTGAITITGTNNDAVLAVSVGSSASVTVNGTVTVTGDDSDGIDAVGVGGPVTINQSGSVAVSGNGANGITATSDGSQITINVGGSVTANGDAADGVDVNNNIGAGDATVTIQSGATVTGGSGAGDAIDFSNGATNRLINFGTIVAPGENAIEGSGSGDEIIQNSGTITGSVDLGAGTNSFDNMAGGLFNAGPNVDLGAGNDLTNSGTVAPGSMGAVQTTALTGDYIQTAPGRFAVDVDGAGATNDRLNITGTANLAGTVFASFTSLPPALQGSTTILSATGGTTNAGITAEDSIAVDYSLSFPNANDLVLNYTINFTPFATVGGMTPNQIAVGTNFNSMLTVGANGMSPILLDVLAITDPLAYLAALDRLHGEHYLVQVGVTYDGTRAFAENLLSCPSRLDGAAAAMAEKSCIWARVAGKSVEIDRKLTNIGGDETVWGFSGGYEAPLSLPGMRAGLALSVEGSDLETNNAASSEGTRFTAGAKIEKAWGRFEVGIGAFGGIATYDTRRIINLGGSGTATGTHDIGYGAVVGRISYAFEAGGVRLVPMLDLSATYLSYGGIRESGAGPANLIIGGEGQWILSAVPAIGITANLAETGDYVINAALIGGVSLQSDAGYTFNSRFSGAPAAVADFVTIADFDDIVGNISAALELQKANGTSLSMA
ncbi:MAG: hypothetical protein KDJ16_08575, partial [Hyphomicrobiales bacterium]|nr:hypothetical protein [Hyphomicrobiales bacterium]